MVRSRGPELLLGEWACLGLLVSRRSHGFDVARRLSPLGDLGRVWTLSRPLTYRALTNLAQRGLVRVAGTEPGTAGGARTILAPTTAGRSAFKRWVRTPVEHLRQVRSELLVKLVLCDLVGLDACPLVVAQRAVVADLAAALRGVDDGDAVAIWREESSEAVVRFLDRLRC
jgi:DNA-binding PadR family transcriptional regulator